MAAEAAQTGRLVQVLPDWADERYPLYTCHLPPAEVRAFLAFIQQVAAASSGNAG